MQIKGDITDKEQMAIDELRLRLKNELEQDLYDDVYFFRRFLRARDYNIDNAESMVRNHLEWRKQHDVRNILNLKCPEVLEKYLSFELLAYDKEGYPIRYSHSGNTDTIGIVKSLKTEDLVKGVIFLLEVDTRILKEQSEKLGKNLDKFICVLNLENVSFAQVTDKRSIHALVYILHLYLNNYPERLKAIYLYNAPIYFNIVYTILRSILPSNVINKIHVYSDESYKEDLLKIVDADEWPAFLGGNLTDPDGNPLCLTKINHAVGPVPEKYFLQKSKRSLSKLSGAQKVTLSRAAFHEVKLDVKVPGSYLEWEFETKCRDIGFGLFNNKMIDEEEQIIELVPIQRIDTEYYPETGTLKCEHPGTYVIVFDNTYSWIRTKEIHYRVKISSPEEHEADAKQE